MRDSPKVHFLMILLVCVAMESAPPSSATVECRTSEHALNWLLTSDPGIETQSWSPSGLACSCRDQDHFRLTPLCLPSAWLHTGIILKLVVRNCESSVSIVKDWTRSITTKRSFENPPSFSLLILALFLHHHFRLTPGSWSQRGSEVMFVRSDVARSNLRTSCSSYCAGTPSYVASNPT